MTEVEQLHSEQDIWEDKVAQVVSAYIDTWNLAALEDYVFQQEVEFFTNPTNKEELQNFLDFMEVEI